MAADITFYGVWHAEGGGELLERLLPVVGDGPVLLLHEQGTAEPLSVLERLPFDGDYFDVINKRLRAAGVTARTIDGSFYGKSPSSNPKFLHRLNSAAVEKAILTDAPPSNDELRIAGWVASSMHDRDKLMAEQVTGLVNDCGDTVVEVFAGALHANVPKYLDQAGIPVSHINATLTNGVAHDIYAREIRSGYDGSNKESVFAASVLSMAYEHLEFLGHDELLPTGEIGPENVTLVQDYVFRRRETQNHGPIDPMHACRNILDIAMDV